MQNLQINKQYLSLLISVLSTNDITSRFLNSKIDKLY